jgi:tetratricopeptide (TPR) repeat protein/tRNA A-37 threonylcarbamoyl transferase component Bud32
METMTRPQTLVRVPERRCESHTVDLPPRAPDHARDAPLRNTITRVRAMLGGLWTQAFEADRIAHERLQTSPMLAPDDVPREEPARERGLVPLRPGQRIPGSRYRIVRWLGEGGMGVVYEAEHIDMQRRAAVKILRAEACHNAAVVRAFRDEARAASRICSEFIVQLYDFAELPDDRLMIAMELLSGHTLHHELSQRMEIPRAVGILRQVCRGLVAAHAVGVVHRDIKPENVFLTTKDGRADAVKLVDFGIAAIHDGTESTAIRGGTPYYLAPEVGVHGSVAPSVDVYAWGCLAFELLTGRVPFEGDDTVEVLRAHLAVPPPVPSSLRSEIPAGLDAVILRCLDKDPASRLPSMVEVEAALCEAQLAHGLRTPWDDLPLPMVEPARRERLAALLPDAAPPAGRRRRPLVMLVASAALLLSSGAALASWGSRDASAQAQHDDAAFIDARGREARAAAAKALFVFPPVDEPHHPTAYTVVRTIEQHEGPLRAAALALAAELRAELAATLVRLGNDYWGKDGGRVFATAYYDQALLFDPNDAVARERSSMSEAQREAFALRAWTLSFAEAELLGAEPLVVLAATDPDARLHELTALADRRRRRTAALDRTLAQLCGLSPDAVADDPATRSAGRTTPPATSSLAEASSPDQGGSRARVGADEGGETSGPSAGKSGGRPRAERATAASFAAAKALASKGKAALAAGHLGNAEALFEQALGHDRNHVAALAGLRDVAFERSAYERAVKLGERVVRERPRTAEHRLRLGDAYLKVLLYHDALEQYERAKALGERRADWRIAKVRKMLGTK